MAEPKPFASLSSTLLARKGHARPAMRPQGFGAMVTRSAPPIDDLGWNDMGHDVPAPVAPAPAEVPAVLRQREELSEAVEAAPAPAPAQSAPPAPAPVIKTLIRAAAGTSGKAAFTLRLPADRHLRLRLACAVRHRSAQQLVTEALDRLLDTIPEVEELACQLPDPATTTKGE